MARSAARNRSEWVLVVVLFWLLRTLPRTLGYALARALVGVMRMAAPRFTQVARRNLDLAAPEFDATRRQRCIDGCFENMARVLVGIANFPVITKDNLHRWIRVEGLDNLEAALRRGKGALIIAGHLGNWELGGISHAWFSAPLSVVVRPLDNPLLERIAVRYRSVSGNKPVSRRDSPRQLIHTLRNNGVVGIFIDQNTTPDRGLFVDFFGVPACVDGGLAKLAGHTGAAMIPVFAVWSEAERRYVLRYYPPIEPTGDQVRDTQAAQSALEAAVREYPEQWLWIHRRWKTRPEGAPPVYS